jgi:hypothetical protein
MRFYIILFCTMVAASSGHSDSGAQKRAEAIHQANLKVIQVDRSTGSENRSLKAAHRDAKAASAKSASLPSRTRSQAVREAAP